MPNPLRRPFVLAFIVVCGTSIAIHGQKPAVADVLKAAATYLADYSQRVGVVAAEETYTQYDTRIASATKRFESEFVLVGLADGQLASFRDVYAIDSNALRPRDGRLLKLLAQPASASVQDEATAITNEALRYYVNTNLRSLDMPTLPLVYLLAANQGKSVFTLDSVKNQGGAQVAIVKFKVTDGTGLVPVPDGATTTGRFWIETGSGAIRQTEFSVSDRAFSFRAAAKYTRDATLGLWVPAELFQQIDISGTVQGMTTLGAVASPDGMMSGARQSLEGRTAYKKYRRLPGTS